MRELPDDPKELKPSKFNCGDRVLARCDEAGCPPVVEATVSAVMWNHRHNHYEYEVTELDGGRSDGYTDSWLSLVTRTTPQPQPHEWTAEELFMEYVKAGDYLNSYFKNLTHTGQLTWQRLADAINKRQSQ